MKETVCSRVNGCGLRGASSWLILMTNPVVNDRAVSLRFTMCLTRPISVQLTFTRLLVRDIALLFVFRRRRSSQGRRKGNAALICIVTRVTHPPPEPLMQWWHRGHFPATLAQSSLREQHVGPRLDSLTRATRRRSCAASNDADATSGRSVTSYNPFLGAEAFIVHWLTSWLHVGVMQRRLEFISRRAKLDEPHSKAMKVTSRSRRPFITGKSFLWTLLIYSKVHCTNGWFGAKRHFLSQSHHISFLFDYVFFLNRYR